MLISRLAVLAALSATFSSSAPTLRVLRATPSAEAEPESPITVTFDRPVAGGLERTVDAAKYFRIEPAVEGRVEWRDPVTIRFTPAAPLPRYSSYRVTIAPGLVAMDGARLESPYTFEFRVAGPRVLGGFPANAWSEARFLPPSPTLTLYLASEADAAVVARTVQVEIAKPCAARTVPVRVVAQRPIRDDDPDWARRINRAAGPEDARRAVEVQPVSPLPAGCAGVLVVPERIDAASPGQTQHWRLATHGAFALAELGCGGRQTCATGPLVVRFTTPVRGGDVLRHVRLEPKVAFTIADTAAEFDRWTLEARLEPRSSYAVVVDGDGLRDVFGQPFTGVNVRAYATSGVPPAVVYPFGKLLVEREGFGTLAVQHVNLDTLLVTYRTVPRRLEANFLADAWGGWRELWDSIAPGGTRLALPVQGEADRARVTGVKVKPAGPEGTLVAVRIAAPGKKSEADGGSPIALVQVTDLAVHARVGMDAGAVWVTGVSDGKPRAGAEVTLYDREGKARARGRTDASGVAVLSAFAPSSASDAPPPCPECEYDGGENGFAGYVAATLGGDRAVVGLSAYDPDLSPWRFGADRAWGMDAWPVAGAVFTERGIYRPGEVVYAKAIVRAGPLGSLRPPASSDSVKLVFGDRERGKLLETTLAPSRFGTADARLRIPAEAPLGTYPVRVQLRRDGHWRTLATATYEIAEYRPPEFLIDLTTADTVRYAGDTLRAALSARYLFGAPMGRAPVQWSLRQQPLSPWGLRVPGLDGWEVGGRGWWGDADFDSYREPRTRVVAMGVDTLDAAGRLALSLPVPVPEGGDAMRTTVVATVTDANRQTVAAARSVTTHAASFYIAAKATGEDWFWKAGDPVRIQVLAVKPTGERVAGVRVSGRVVRHEWHEVRRWRNGYASNFGEWVADTVATCAITTAAEPGTCAFTPKEGGTYTVELTAPDPGGRTAKTAFNRWVTGPGFVPWNDDSRFKLELIADKSRYTVGDTATVLVAAPFTGAEAWVTVERERILEQRRIRITAGSTTLKFPITEAFVPNVFVSVIMVRGRSAPPGTVDDPGRPTIRVGYVELRVLPEPKRLKVAVKPLQPEYRPGDSARVAVQVTNGHGGGERAEVTLWAVDEGVLALTGYATPDPMDLIYARRGLGVKLASNLVAVAPQVPEGEKGRRAPGGGGGRDAAGVLRSEFRPTAFFLGSVVTDAQGRATAAAKLPDNITTFRVMAVAVTEGDRYGSGESSLLATRPLVVRPALPRFLREGDAFLAGVVVNQRLGGTPKVKVAADATGVKLKGPTSRTVVLEAGRGAEVRFSFQGEKGDSARFRFDASGAGERDAVQVKLPIRPNYHPVAHTVAGALHDTATVALELPAGIDPKRSRLELSFGESPLAMLRGYHRRLQVYPYGCTEQVSSQALPLIALYRAQQTLPDLKLLEGDPAAEIAKAVRAISRRQRADGGIGYWSDTDWTTPWLSAYAGRVLLEARAAGVEVPDAVLDRLAEYLSRALHGQAEVRFAVARWYTDPSVPFSDQVAAAEFLSRLGRPDVPAENELVAQAARLAWEDRLVLAEMLARRGQAAIAKRIAATTLADVRVEGRKAVLPTRAARAFYFPSQTRPAARAVTALLATDPRSPLLGPLVETLVDQGRVQALAPWNTQDYGMAVLALAQIARSASLRGDRPIRVRHDGRAVLELKPSRNGVGQAGASLEGLLGSARGEKRPLRLTLETTAGELPVFYYLTVREVPLKAATTPREAGIAVERWYERLSDGKPTVEIAEGEVVRVRLRITVPSERHFVVLDDALPAGLEPVDLSLRTVSPFQFEDAATADRDLFAENWFYGSWDAGAWSPFDHKEIRDDRVVYSATVLWPGTYGATYLARGTTAGSFVTPPAHAEEMYNPGVNGRNGGGRFTVRAVK